MGVKPITLEELYDFQTPYRWIDENQGKLMIARNSHPVGKNKKNYRMS